MCLLCLLCLLSLWYLFLFLPLCLASSSAAGKFLIRSRHLFSAGRPSPFLYPVHPVTPPPPLLRPSLALSLLLSLPPALSLSHRRGSLLDPLFFLTSLHTHTHTHAQTPPVSFSASSSLVSGWWHRHAGISLARDWGSDITTRPEPLTLPVSHRCHFHPTSFACVHPFPSHLLAAAPAAPAPIRLYHVSSSPTCTSLTPGLALSTFVRLSSSPTRRCMCLPQPHHR